MPSSLSLSPDDRDGLLRRFLAASRHGEIIALINAARSEDDLGAVIATELCEAFDAEIGFVLIVRPGSTRAEVLGSVGLVGDDVATITVEQECTQTLAGAAAVAERGTDLLGLGIHNLALAPHTAGGARLLVGVGRLYDQRWEALELALLEGVTKSAAQALERFGLERQLQQAHEMEVGRRQAPQPARDADAVEPPTTADATPTSLPDLVSLAHLFRLLGHPIRLRILRALGSETLSPSELDEQLEVGLALLSYHVGVLRDDGLLMLVDTRPTRGALESFYRLTPRGELALNVFAATSREMSRSPERP
jgi:DNA-binding transcriptional ArsR family regulator